MAAEKQHHDKHTGQDSGTTRREFIERTLKITAGAYVGMNIVEQFVGPKLGQSGMPLFAASGRVMSNVGGNIGTEPSPNIYPGPTGDDRPHRRPPGRRGRGRRRGKGHGLRD